MNDIYDQQDVVLSPIIFTNNAASKVAQLIEEEGNPDLKLRVFVQGGGCSGFQYGFTFDEIINEDDTSMSKNGVQLLIDPMSYQYLVGAEIDYKEDLEGAQFVIKNPNAINTCGCGSSFSVVEVGNSGQLQNISILNKNIICIIKLIDKIKIINLRRFVGFFIFI